jgi:hypothetical protein
VRIYTFGSLVGRPERGASHSGGVIFHPIRLVGRLLVTVVIVAAGLAAVGTAEAERVDSGAMGFSELPSHFVDEPTDAAIVVRDRISVGMDQILDRGANALFE